MYFLLNMGIFQPAMFVYQRVPTKKNQPPKMPLNMGLVEMDDLDLEDIFVHVVYDCPMFFLVFHCHFPAHFRFFIVCQLRGKNAISEITVKHQIR